MASQFKIPKKKQPGGSDSAHFHMQSPLSRLQSSTPKFKSYGDSSERGSADRMHAGSSNRRSSLSKPWFSNAVKTLLGINSPSRDVSAANHGAAGGLSRQSQPSVCVSNGWRPKRASDRLLQPDGTSERPSPPQKRKTESSGSSPLKRSISVSSVDSLAELRDDQRPESLSPLMPAKRTWRRTENNIKISSESPKQNNSSLSGSEDDFMSPSTTRNKPPASASSSVSTVTPNRRRSLDRRLFDDREKHRDRWREFRERKMKTTSAVHHPLLRRPKQTPSEPIVLSSEEEEEGEKDEAEEEQGEEEGDGGQKKPSRVDQSQSSEHIQVYPSRDEATALTSPPSFLQLEFTSLHAGLMHANANRKMMITESGINLPLKASTSLSPSCEEEVEVCVVASQVRGYGVWDGGVAQGGALLAGWEGPAPSLLFLWVSDAQANLLQRELNAIQTTTTTTSASSCSFLLLVLKEQLQELQAALLASILDMEEFRRGRSSSSSSSTSSSSFSGRLSSPLDWTDGLLLLHSCPPPLDQHFLRLLGHSTEPSSPVRSSQRNRKLSRNSPGLQQLSSRLIQYPPPPCKGRITVTKEDLACLNGGEFLNDVIIDFYLKFLLLEGVGGAVAERSHVFSSFFYKQLSRRRAAGEDDTPSVPDRQMRHQRVKTWTRHVDIFTKDFLFVPVNQEAHWFLVLVCFPGLEEVQYEECQSRTGDSEWPAVSLRSHQPPECTQQGWKKDAALKRPCILVMDSLKLSYHENVCRLLRDYLQVEWEVRRGTPRHFTSDTMRSSSCRVPQQDNSSDCGLYLLQYAESFLQNPVVHFDLPPRLDNWFLRQRVRQKRESIRSLIMRLHQTQQHD